MIKYSRSKIMAWVILLMSGILTALSIVKGMEGPASAIFLAGVPSATTLYLGKNYNDRKWSEFSNKTNK